MTIRITGSFTYDRKDEIDRFVAEIAGGTDITLDLSEVSDIDAFGIGVLVSLRKTMAQRYREIGIHPDEPVERLIRVQGIDHLMKLIDVA
ncbi:MAG: STAS domain-containing protein [bacterium]|nr:STAS domain-containing protein [bacterium]